ncbi:auxilin-like protein 1 isoform X2 [Salvia splendens]|uniref:auxilin-like protein 1 isoform X2 n=1 Tax=Salvia splendens TaxID=180675 RepID=UPI001C264857|nr:auxilin-like protein 1 isoform X2 [Salvia splendens]
MSSCSIRKPKRGNGLQQQFNLSFNKTSQRSSNESNGKTHIAQLQAVPGFTHFVDDGTPQPQKKEGDDTPVPLVKREVSRTWSFSTGSDATKVKRGLSSEKSHTPDKSCLPIFASKDASVEIGGENPPPLSDEELDENSDAAKSIAALKKAIEQAQESMRLAKMIMQKKREGTKDGSRAWRSKGRSKVEVLEDEKETRTEHASGGSKENNLKGKNQRLDPTVHVPGKVGGRSNPALSHSDSLLNARKANVESVVEIFKPTKTEHASGGSKENNLEGKNQRLGPTYHVLAEVDGKSDPILSHSDNLLNARKANVESVMEIFEPANDHGDVFVEVDKNSTPSCSQSGSTNTDKKDEMKNIRQNVGISELHGETTDFTGLAETSVLESGKVDCNASSPMHQAERPGDISRRIESAENTSKSQQELEQSSNEEAADQCQATASTVKGPAKLLEQLERVLSVSGSTQEQEKIMHGNGHLRISQENEPPEDTGCIADKEMYEKKFVEHEELYLAEHSTMRRSNFNTLHNDLLTQAEENMIDQAHIDEQPENVAEWKEDDQDAQFSDEGENAMVLNEEIIWYDSELQLEESVEENVNEREPGIVPVVEEAVTKVDMVFKSEIDEKLKFELDEVSQTVPGIIGENEIAMRCMDASEFEQIETIQIGTNGGDKEVQNGRTPLDVEELNHTDGAADTRKNLPDIGRKLNDSASQKDNSEAFAVHSNDHGTIFSDSHGVNTSTFFSRTPEPCSADNEAEQYRAVLRGREENYSLPLETEEENEADKQFEVEVNIMPGTDSLCGCSSAEKLTESQVDNTYDGFSSDSKSTSFVLTNVDQEKTLPNNEDMFKTATEIHNAANTNMQNFSEQHVSTDNQLERIDTTNVMPDMQQNSENSEESQSTSDMFKTATEIHNAANTNMQNFSEQHVSTDNQLERIDTTNVMPDMQQNSENSEESQSTSDVESVDEVSADESPACRDNAKDISSYMEEEKVDLDMKSDERVNAAKQSGCLNSKDQTHLSQTNSEPKEMDKSSEAEREIKTGQHMEENIQNRGRTSLSENKDAKGNEQDEMDSWQRIEAIRRGREREKGRMAAEREREKDRIAVERAIREARERAFAEARERAERAAAAEAHRRVNGEVREKTVKASVGTRPSVDKASTEAKIRVERAAVERATAEARERALEKAMSQKNSMGSRGQATKYNAERSSSSSSNNGLKHSFSFYDLEKSDGTTSESAKRCKASLERHQRIMERAAKALAEKNTYDLLAQKEQDERSRLAKSLDADIKRWATGKEGNLRALLSTLQYILGPDSAWHPVSLTDIVTAAAVKKTYRKATLCVHPDKLQQRGASIQQKYICEKIFDLLKVAWNKFNSEEN